MWWSPPQLDSSHSSFLAQGCFSFICPLTLSPASLIFTSLFSTGVFPSEYKHVIISSIKKKSPLTPTFLFSYCSISLLALTANSLITHHFHCLTSSSAVSPFQASFLFLPLHRNSSCQGCLLLNSVIKDKRSWWPVSSICHSWSLCFLKRFLS